VAVYNHGAGDILEVRLAVGGKTELIAFADAFVPAVDLAGRRVVVRLDGSGDNPDDDQGKARDEPQSAD
jgi:16S rRNA processing protein RimM